MRRTGLLRTPRLAPFPLSAPQALYAGGSPLHRKRSLFRYGTEAVVAGRVVAAGGGGTAAALARPAVTSGSQPSMAGSPHCRTMDDLDDVTLELVFAYACAQHGGRAPAAYRPNPALPLVCKRWRAVYEHSSLLWEEVCVDCSAIARRCGTGLAHYAGRWVAARLPFCRRLVLAAFPDAPLPLGEVMGPALLWVLCACAV